MNWTISNIDELDTVAEALLKQLKPAVIYGLEGSLGAGKTTLVAALLKQLNYEGVSSPTFSIIHRYDAKIPVIHMDLYRMENDLSLDMLDLEHYFSQTNAYFFVEWPQRLKNLGYDYTVIQIDKVNKHDRSITLVD